MNVRFQRGLFDRWIIVHPTDDGLAWSGSRWVAHREGMPLVGVQVCNFDSEDDARAYVKGARLE